MQNSATEAASETTTTEAETLLPFDPNGRAIIDDNQGTRNAVECVLKGVQKKRSVTFIKIFVKLQTR